MVQLGLQSIILPWLQPVFCYIPHRYSHRCILLCCLDCSDWYILLCYIALTIATDTIILLRCLDYSPCYILSYRCDYSQCCTLLYCLYYSHWKSLLFCLVYSNPSAQRFRGHVERQIIIIITYIYNALNDALSASRIHNKLKTILSKYIHIRTHRVTQRKADTQTQ